ncbi:MAG: hypothetical protein QF858_02030 [Candidatus Pacebacteria bacterium]|jgi:hypothetical protein|nr:hypothetical protein [bacterium]MDP6527635.1 hypothetical protein [Candidatus Paceibacterota bacterium]MDP6659448.1 hypothetical protein [Candidatus Paceibacterota bacterium]|tara:strand:+ start:5449 stop:5778 length:330 start_codon:yes stop_codon:yes gene_type:complete
MVATYDLTERKLSWENLGVFLLVLFLWPVMFGLVIAANADEKWNGWCLEPIAIIIIVGAVDELFVICWGVGSLFFDSMDAFPAMVGLVIYLTGCLTTIGLFHLNNYLVE